MTTTEATAIQNSGAEELIKRINMIINLIPNNFDKRELVVLSLQSRLESIPYTAPEIMTDRWHEVSTILSTYLPDPENCAWTKQIAELFGKPY